MNKLNNKPAFSKAQRQSTFLKLAITGPSGSGKTYSSLLLASGLGARIALLDTENGSAALYADQFEFDTLAMNAPYEVKKYLWAIEQAEEAGYDVMVIDSISHCWAGEGGLLEQKSVLDSRGGKQNQYTNWASITKLHEQFKARLLSSKLHLIATMRSKQEYVLEVNDQGKQIPRKLGMAPIQRDSIEYEFTIVFDLAMDHSAASSKDRTGLFDGRIFTPSKNTGEELIDWLKSATPANAISAASSPQTIVSHTTNHDFIGRHAANAPEAILKESTGVNIPKRKGYGPILISQAQIARLMAIGNANGYSYEDIKARIKDHFNKDSSKDLVRDEYDGLVNWIYAHPKNTNQLGSKADLAEAAKETVSTPTTTGG